MDNTVKLKLKYSGEDVDEGSMAIEDMIPILQGFIGVYGRIVGYRDFKSKHELRLQEIKRGSCDLIIMAKQFARDFQEVAPLIVLSYNEIIDVIKTIKGLLDMTILTKKRDFEVRPGPNYGTQIIINAEKIEFTVPNGTVELFQETGIKKSLSHLAVPLEAGKIDRGKIIATAPDGETIESEINCDNKQYFEIEGKEVVTSKEIWIEGTINMMRKSTNKGELIVTNGSKVPFELKMEIPENYYSFFEFKGAVKMRGIVHFDESLEPTRIEALDIQKLQGEMFQK